MDIKEFLQNTVCEMDTTCFDSVKEILLNKYLTFSIITENLIGKEILSEKLSDYFETLSVKTGRTFDKQIEVFMNDIDAITAPRIIKTLQKSKENSTQIIITRARKYYEKAISIKGNRNLTARQLLDYTRLMMCLYTASMNNDDKPVDNFNYSPSCLEPNRILEHMGKEEVVVIIPPSRRKRFGTKEKYSSERCTMMLSSIILYAIQSENLQGADS